MFEQSFAPISEELPPLPVQYVTTVAEADFAYQTLQTHESRRFIGNLQTSNVAINMNHVGTSIALFLPQEHTSHSLFDEGEKPCL